MSIIVIKDSFYKIKLRPADCSKTHLAQVTDFLHVAGDTRVLKHCPNNSVLSAWKELPVKPGVPVFYLEKK